MTFNEHFNRQTVNVEVLNYTLRSTIGSAIAGISTIENKNDTTVIVHFNQRPSGEQVEEARQLVNAHDPSVKSPRQQEMEALEILRQKYEAEPLNAESFDSANQPLRLLAEHVAWLEKERLYLLSARG